MPIQSRDASSPWSWWMIGSPGASAVGDGFLRQSFRLPQRRCFRRSLLFEIGFQSEGRCAEGGKEGGLPERPVRWLLNRCQRRSGGRGCSAGARGVQGAEVVQQVLGAFRGQRLFSRCQRRSGDRLLSASAAVRPEGIGAQQQLQAQKPLGVIRYSPSYRAKTKAIPLPQSIGL